VLIDAIGSLLPSAVAVAVSPIPIIAVVLILGTPRARSNGPAFALGWIVGLSAVATVVLLVFGGVDDDAADDGASWLQLALGVLLLVLAVKQWRSRPRDGEPAEMPAWMSRVQDFTPSRSLALGLAASAVNPKNLVLAIAAGAAIAQAGLSAGGDAVAIAVFVAIGSSTVVGSVLFSVVAPARAGASLATVREFMERNNAVIMTVILLLLGAKLVGDGLGGVAR
jgi:threonine/homoserine/homoserine lactone efflux protein